MRGWRRRPSCLLMLTVVVVAGCGGSTHDTQTSAARCPSANPPASPSTSVDPSRADPGTAAQIRAAEELNRRAAEVADRWMAVDDNLLSVTVTASEPPSVEVHAESLPVPLADELTNLGVPIEHVKEPFGRARYRELREKIFAFHGGYKDGSRDSNNPFVGLRSNGIDVVATGFDDRRARLIFMIRACVDPDATRQRIGRALLETGIALPDAAIAVATTDAANPTATTANG